MTANHHPCPGAVRQPAHGAGFTYLGLLIFVAIMGIAAVATLQAGHVVQRRAAEEELLDIGAAFRDALDSYVKATPAGQARFPQSLPDLLRDPRYPEPRRYLRKLYVDPLTGKAEWGTLVAPDEGSGKAGIVGVYSLSNATPIKVANFDAPFQQFAGKTSYRDWKFMIGLQAAGPGAPPQAARHRGGMPF